MEQITGSSAIASEVEEYIKEIRRLKSELRENEKQQIFLTHLLKNSVDFLILTDSNMNIAYCSDSFLNEIGVTHFDDVNNENILDIYSRFYGSELFEQLANMLAIAVGQDETTRHDIEMNSAECGELRAYRITNTPMIDKNVNGVIINWNNITDINNAKKSAEEANKSKSNFLATMSHEIRTPMNAILGITQIQLQNEDLSEEYSSALNKIHNSGSNLLGIINDILDMSRIESGKLEINDLEYDVPSFINDAVQLNIVRIGSKPLDFFLDIDENIPSRMIGDELRLKQILNNLLSNAIKYTDSGYVKLSVDHSRRENDIILRFSVEDTGQGMTPEDQKRLFSEYSRFNIAANRTTEGAGLGLSITKNLITMMNGEIKVESEYGKGSKFISEVRQQAVECAPIGAELAKGLCTFTFTGEKQTSKLQISRELMPYGKVLVVDDVDTNLYVAEGLLSQYKLNIETVNSGFGAIEKIDSGKAYDIIFMDHMMPLMDGIETTKKLRAMGYEGVIVALTANALTGNDVMFKQNGFDDFISKPIDIRYLNTILNKFIRDKHPEEAEKYKRMPVMPPESIKTATLNPRILNIFRRDAEKAVITLRETLAENNIKLFATTAHAMKSALANIGEKEISVAAQALEEAGVNGNMEFIVANANTFIKLLEDLIIKITLLETKAGADEEADEDITYLIEQLHIIELACNDYEDKTAYAALDQLAERVWRKDTSSALEYIRDLIYFDSDFEKAAEQAIALSEHLGHIAQ